MEFNCYVDVVYLQCECIPFLPAGRKPGKVKLGGPTCEISDESCFHFASYCIVHLRESLFWQGQNYVHIVVTRVQYAQGLSV